MGPACPALHVAVGEQDEQGQRSELERQAVQHCGGGEEEQRACDYEAADVAGAELAGGQCAGCGARVGCVEVAVDQAVEAHGGAACGDHADYDPAEDGEPRPSSGGEYCSGEREGQREDGVFPLDHLKGYGCALPEGGHVSMVRDNAAAKRTMTKEKATLYASVAEGFKTYALLMRVTFLDLVELGGDVVLDVLGRGGDFVAKFVGLGSSPC